MTSTRDQAVSAFLRSLDVALFRALGESARVAVLEVLLRHPDSDVASIAAELPQDGSVIARHLQILERAGLVRSRKASSLQHRRQRPAAPDRRVSESGEPRDRDLLSSRQQPLPVSLPVSVVIIPARPIDA
jgi:DNA-binding transcriptional ArsR family regulator